MAEVSERLSSEFIEAAIWHGPLTRAKAILAKYPELAGSSIHVAAVLGDYESVQNFLDQDAGNATAVAGPFAGNALVYLSLSRYFRLGKQPAYVFLKIAKALLDAGADANSGFWQAGDRREYISALYGAAGVAQHAGFTKLLLDYGADPNDEEAVYHSPETWENSAMELLVKTGKLTPANLCMMLIRKHDFHDTEGARLLLENGADPNMEWRPGFYPIHHALKRCNGIDMIELLLNYGADPYLSDGHHTAIAHAARTGRGDVLALLKERNISLELYGVDELIAACAEDDTEQIAVILQKQPQLTDEIKTIGGSLLARFAGNGNAAGLQQLLNLGIDVNTPFTEGDPYFEIPINTYAIHVAAWRGWPNAVIQLIKNGATVDEPDANGNTPLMLAVKACVNSYWTYRKSTEAITALLEAGAKAERVPFPTGYAAADVVLGKYL